MLTINKKIVLFELFVVIMFICQFRLAEKQGYILFPLEICIVCLYFFWNKHKLRVPSTPILLYLFFIVYRIIFSFIMSGGDIKSVKALFYKELGMIFLCWFLTERYSSISIIRKIKNFGFIMSIFGCYEFVTHSAVFMKFITVESRMYMRVNLGTAEMRVRTVFLHPTICGVFMTLAWLCVLFIPYRKRWLNYVAKITIFLCLLGTQSRSNWIAFFIINLLYIWRKYKKKGISLEKRNIIQAAVLLILALIIAVIFNEYIKNIYQLVINRWIAGMDSNNAGNYNRVTMIKMGLQEWTNLGIPEKIFGSGSGYAKAFLLKHPIRGWSAAVDNQYLTVLLDFGLLGLILLLWIGGYIFKIVILDDNEIDQLCGLGLLSMFISAFFYEMFSWITITLMFSLFLSLIDKDSSIENNSF